MELTIGLIEKVLHTATPTFFMLSYNHNMSVNTLIYIEYLVVMLAVVDGKDV